MWAKREPESGNGWLIQQIFASGVTNAVAEPLPIIECLSRPTASSPKSQARRSSKSMARTRAKDSGSRSRWAAPVSPGPTLSPMSGPRRVEMANSSL